jgi:hypothetical protein
LMLFAFRCAFDIQSLLRPESIGCAPAPIVGRIVQLRVKIGPSTTLQIDGE